MSDHQINGADPLPVPGPRHQNVARTLMREIVEGVYPVGSKLPTEHELCRQFGASRHTIRVALDHLVRAGVIKRTPRLGTVVMAREPRRGYQLAVQQISDLQQHGSETHMRVLVRSLEVADGSLEPALTRYEGQHWLYVEGLRFSKDFAAPISYHEVWVHPDYRAVQGVSGELHKSIFRLVEEQFGVQIVKVRQTIQSAQVDGEIAQHLRLPDGTACLWVRREYYDARGELVELSLSVHPGHQFTYEMVIEARPAASPDRAT